MPLPTLPLPTTIAPGDPDHAAFHNNVNQAVNYLVSDTQTQNEVLAAPSGANGSGVFRLLTAADIPTLTSAKISDFATAVAAIITADIGVTIQAFNANTTHLGNTVTGSGGTLVEATNPTLAGATINTDLVLSGAPGKIKPAVDSTTALQMTNAAGTSILDIDTSNGFVGIGETPDRPLTILSANAGSGISLDKDLVSSSGFGVLFRKIRGSLSVNNNDELGWFDFNGYDGASYQRAALIYMLVDGAPATGSVPGTIQFYTAPVGGSALKRMAIRKDGLIEFGGSAQATIDANGLAKFPNLGIGASTIYRLTLSGLSQGGAYIGINTSNAAANDILYYANVSNAITGSTNLMSMTAPASTGTVALFANADITNATAHSTFKLQVGGANSGDPRLQFGINGVIDWAIGLDNSDSDQFVIAANGNLGTSNVLKLSTTLMTLSDAVNIALGTTTGTKIGTLGGASGQKIGFFNQTPIVQPLLATGAGHTVDDVITTLQNLGLVRQT